MATIRGADHQPRPADVLVVFFTVGTIFGAMGPAFYGALIGNGSSRTGLFIGYLVGAGIMLLGGIVELLIGSTPRASRWRLSPNPSPPPTTRP